MLKIRVIVLFFLLGVYAGFYLSPAYSQTQPPNIVMIISDDQGMDAIQGHAWNNELNVRTPTLASLALQGRVFNNTRFNPVCSPTRAALFTGRSACKTGVTYVLKEQTPLPDRDLVSLQTNERTIGEMLQDLGYYTILIDKWHMGYSTEMGQQPAQQGFDVDYQYADYILLDDPEILGDEHMTRMVNFAIQEVNNRPDSAIPGQKVPYALFYCSIDPHRRIPWDSEGMAWWKVDSSLLPSGEPYYQGLSPTNRDRYRAVVEALDTEVDRLLKSINVIDNNGIYNQNSNAVVFYAGDNGTDREISVWGEKAKGELFEAGIKVPMFVFGEGVPADGAIETRLVNHTDFYDTIADIVGATDQQRGSAPRDSFSFADRIGWAAPSQNPRQYTISSQAIADPADHWVALADANYKLIAKAGGTGLVSLDTDRFFDLVADPLEDHDLVIEGMSAEQAITYINMRNDLVNYWPLAVSEAWVSETLAIPVVHENEQYKLIVIMHADGPAPPDQDQFYDLYVDPEELDNLIISGMDEAQLTAYNEMRAAVTSDFASASAESVPYLVDINVTQTLVLSSQNRKITGPLRIGHKDYGTPFAIENRAFLKFDVAQIDAQLPPGMTLDNVVAAQIVIGFSKDSESLDETDTGPITAYPMAVYWGTNTRDWDKLSIGHLSDAPLGSVDLGPHIIPNPEGWFLRGLPMPNGTPVSFGYSPDLVQYIRHWHDIPNQNMGIVLIAEPLDDVTGDQMVDFLRIGGLRLTLRY